MWAAQREVWELGNRVGVGFLGGGLETGRQGSGGMRERREEIRKRTSSST